MPVDSPKSPEIYEQALCGGLRLGFNFDKIWVSPAFAESLLSEAVAEGGGLFLQQDVEPCCSHHRVEITQKQNETLLSREEIPETSRPSSHDPPPGSRYRLRRAALGA
ncbi:hypothetical protein V2G26_019276 [Clonostachys chloroleuca]